MKILIITENVGGTAPGMVFERLIQGLAKHNDISVLTANYESDLDLTGVKNIVISGKLYFHPRIDNLLITLFGVNPYDCYWSLKSTRILKRRVNNEFDIVMSFVSYSHFAGLITGYHYSKTHNINHAVYSVDAIPPPVGWLKYDHYYRGLQKAMSKYLSSASFLFSLNHQMLSYQLKTFIPVNGIITGVIYTPGLDAPKIFSGTNNRVTNNFVYTGGIYGPRKADYLLAGFQKLLKIHHNSKLQFIGTQFLPEIISSIKSGVFKNIEIIPFTRNLDPYYQGATALIDIDADIENDVFLSSKIPNYLMINRIIISETGLNSPSRNLFKGINSIFQCEHNSDQLYLAMIRAIEIKDTISFDDRKSVDRLFQIDNIIEELNCTLSKSNCSNLK